MIHYHYVPLETIFSVDKNTILKDIFLNETV